MSAAAADAKVDPSLVTDLPTEPRRSRGIWLVGALAALALHGSVAVAVVDRAQPPDTDTSDGAPAIDIGLVMTAPHTDNDMPPGVTAEDVAASQANPDAQSKPEKTDLPEDKPTDTDDPDRLVSENPAKKPEETPKPHTVQSKASEQSVASVAAAPPPFDTAQEASRSVAPARGEGDSERSVVTTWQRRLLAYLDRHKRYPKGSLQRDATITIDFSIDRFGHVLAARVAKPSGNAVFDAAALAMLHRADPVPPPPALLADQSLSFSVPVIFTAKRR